MYRKIWTKVYGAIPKDENGRSYEIHHIDGNRRNNSIDNLMCISIREHYDIHYKQGDWAAVTAIAKRMGRVFSGWNHSKEVCDKIGLSKLGNTNMLGKTHTEESKEKNRQSHIGKLHREDTKLKIKKTLTGRERPKQVVAKIKEAKLGEKNPMFGKTGDQSPRSKRLLDPETGLIYESAKEASIVIGRDVNGVTRWIKKGKLIELKK